MPEWDFANPVMHAAIVNPDGTRIPLWTNSFDQGKGIAALPVLTDLVVELNLGHLPKITATLAGPYDTMMLGLLNQEHLRFGQSRIQCQFGYVGTKGMAILSQVFTGLLDQPDVTIGAEVTVSLVGVGDAGYATLRDSRGIQEENISWLDVIKLMAKGDPDSPRKLEVDISAVEEAGGKPLELLTQKRASFAAGYASDWQVIQRKVRDCKCWMNYVQEEVEGGKLVITPADDAALKEPKHRFVLLTGDITDETLQQVTDGAEFTGGTYPILSYNSPTLAVWYPKALVGGFLKVINDKTGESENKNVGGDKDPKDKQSAATGGGQQPKDEGATKLSENKKDGDGGAVYHSDQADKDSEDLIKATVGALKQQGGLKAEVETIGVPDLIPGAGVQILGVGPMFDWTYKVHTVVHTLGTGGYTSNFTAVVESGVVWGPGSKKEEKRTIKNPEPSFTVTGHKGHPKPAT